MSIIAFTSKLFFMTIVEKRCEIDTKNEHTYPILLIILEERAIGMLRYGYITLIIVYSLTTKLDIHINVMDLKTLKDLI